MPKRAEKYYLEPTRKLYNSKIANKKSVTQQEPDEAEATENAETDNIDENVNENADDEEISEPKTNDDKFRESRTIRVRRYNQNNEIERLLLHSTIKLRSALDHCDFPSFNQGFWPQASQDLLTTYPACAFSVPRPIYTSDGLCPKLDLCYKRPMNREHHRRRLLTSKSLYHKFINCKDP